MSSGIRSADAILDKEGVTWATQHQGKIRELKENCKQLCLKPSCLICTLCSGAIIGAGAGLGFFGIGAQSTGDMTGWFIFTAAGAGVGICVSSICLCRAIWTGEICGDSIHTAQGLCTCCGRNC